MPQVDDWHRGLVASIVERRRALRLSQRVVAERMGATQSMVSYLERCHHGVTLGTLQRYARAVGVRIEVQVVADVNG